MDQNHNQWTQGSTKFSDYNWIESIMNICLPITNENALCQTLFDPATCWGCFLRSSTGTEWSLRSHRLYLTCTRAGKRSGSSGRECCCSSGTTTGLIYTCFNCGLQYTYLQVKYKPFNFLKFFLFLQCFLLLLSGLLECSLVKSWVYSGSGSVSLTRRWSPAWPSCFGCPKELRTTSSTIPFSTLTRFNTNLLILSQ